MSQLNDLKIRAWIRQAGAKAICDGGNLWLTPKKGGDPVWVLRYRAGGKRKEFTIGAHSQLGGLSGARVAALGLRVRIARGEDISLSKRMEIHGRRAAFTYSQLFDDYLQSNAERLADTTVKEMQRMHLKDVTPSFGPMLARDIEPLDLVALLRKVKKRSYTVAERLWEQLAVVFAHGVASAQMTVSPCASLRIRSVIGAKPPVKKRIKLTVDELQLVMMRLSRVSEVNACSIKILFYSCVRKSELLNAEWTQINFEEGMWSVPAEVRGNKRHVAYQIPLSPLAVGWFRRLQELAGGSEWVLPAQVRRRDSNKKTMSVGTLNLALSRLGDDLPDFSPHDCRSTARSYLGEFEPNPAVVERALNHSLGGLAEKYDRNTYLEQRKPLMNRWAALLESIENGTCPELSSTKVSPDLANPQRIVSAGEPLQV